MDLPPFVNDCSLFSPPPPPPPGFDSSALIGNLPLFASLITFPDPCCAALICLGVSPHERPLFSASLHAISVRKRLLFLAVRNLSPPDGHFYHVTKLFPPPIASPLDDLAVSNCLPSFLLLQRKSNSGVVLPSPCKASVASPDPLPQSLWITS